MRCSALLWILHDWPRASLLGDHVFAARGHSTSVDFSYADKETWYDAGIGANLSLSSNTDLWLNAKYIFGGYFESSRQINAGVRFSF